MVVFKLKKFWKHWIFWSPLSILGWLFGKKNKTKFWIKISDFRKISAQYARGFRRILTLTRRTSKKKQTNKLILKLLPFTIGSICFLIKSWLSSWEYCVTAENKVIQSSGSLKNKNKKALVIYTDYDLLFVVAN